LTSLAGGAVTLLQGDALTVLRTLEAGTVQCCVTSPPYWGLRDYGTEGQLGLEATPEEYVAALVAGLLYPVVHLPPNQRLKPLEPAIDVEDSAP